MLLKRGFVLTAFALFVMVVLCAGCGGDDGGYEGVGKLVSDRNRARLGRETDKKAAPDPSSSPNLSTAGAEKIPGEVLVEEDVMIVRSSSGRVLAKGTAYLDKDGNIVNIRIRK